MALGLRSPASAQAYPVKPIHIIVPFAAGGITDVIGRALGQRLAEAWGQQVVIENKPGGGIGQVGTESVARSAPDGYTLLVTADATFVTSPHTYSKLPYDPINDFVPVTGLGISPQALVVHPSLPVRTLGDLVDYARKRPGELNYGTFGIGSSGHLNIILLEGMTGTKFTPVHYRGAAPAITDLIGKSRRRPLVNARQICMYVFRELTDYSYPKIAEVFGGRDHTTVMHACEKIRNQLA